MRERIPIVILGGGPAGVAAALKLARRGSFDVTLLERHSIGGNAASFELGGMHVDYGSHRLHPASDPGILADIREMLGEDLLDRPRHGRMLLRGQWVHFPLKPLDLARNLPLSFSAGVLADSIAKLNKQPPGQTFESVLEQGLGRTICRDFYFPYAHKIWGVAPSALDAEQARRRVSAGSLSKMIRKVMKAVPGFKNGNTGRFYYPRRGFGQISHAYCEAARKAGANIRIGATVTRIEVNNTAAGAQVRFNEGGVEKCLSARHVLSTIPLTVLAKSISPAPPPEVFDAASALQFRAMVLIYLVLQTEQFTEFDAHYLPDSSISITRLSEPKHYGLAQLPGKTVLCAELPCSQRDPVWTASDDTLKRTVLDSLALAGIPVRVPVVEMAVRRLPQAYPIYTRDYSEQFDRIDGWLSSIEGIATFGRQGLFAHDNTHHTIAMAYALDECIDDSGRFDRHRWNAHRQAFKLHVVED